MGPPEVMMTSALTKEWGLDEEDAQEGRRMRAQKQKDNQGKIPWILVGNLERTPLGEAARKVSMLRSRTIKMPEGLDRPEEGGDWPAEDLDQPKRGGDQSNLDQPTEGGGRLDSNSNQSIKQEIEITVEIVNPGEDQPNESTSEVEGLLKNDKEEVPIPPKKGKKTSKRNTS